MRRYIAKARWLLATYIALSLCTAACGSPFFTRGFRENHRLQPEEIKQVQFYTSGPIRLRRSENSQQRALGDNSFDLHARVEVKEVYIPGGTPCVAVDVRNEYIAVSFTPHDRARVLWFSTVDSPVPERYALSHVVRFGEVPNAAPEYSKGYTVRYGEHDYRVVEPDTWSVYLKFDEDVTLDRMLQQESPKGWRLGN